MSPLSGSRAQTELSSLIAVFAVCAGLALFAGQVGPAMSEPAAPRTADVVADRVADQMRVAGVIHPTRLAAGHGAVPTGRQLNVTLAAGDSRWTAGPPAPATARTASRRVGVWLGPGDVRPGRLWVAIWR